MDASALSRDGAEAANNKFDLVATLTIKHGGLADAVKRVGTQAALARLLEVTQGEVSAWCRLVRCPPKTPTLTWTQERIDKLETELLVLTGRTLDDLFPDELRRQCHRKACPRVYEKRMTIEREALCELAGNFSQRMTLPAPDEILFSGDQAKAIQRSIDRVLCTLSHREREIIKLRYGIGHDGNSHTLEDVARMFKVTKERIRQIEAKAIRKLQQPSRSQQLSGFLDGEPVNDGEAGVLSPLSEKFREKTA